MNIKFLNLSTKKFISILCAVAILMASLPLSALLMKVNAAEGEIIDFQGEDAGDIVAGNDHFTIGGQDNADKEYFYASNATEETVTLTVDGFQLQAGKKYTVDMDIYALGLTKDPDDKMFGIKIYGGSEASAEEFAYRNKVSIEEWTNFHFSFTAKEGSDKLDFSAFTSASALIEDFTIVSEDGQKVAIDLSAACAAYSGEGTFAYGTLAQLTGASMKPTGPAFNGDPDYVVYFDNSSSNAFWLTELGMKGLSLPKGNTYKVEFDVYSLTLGYRVVFNGVKAHMNTAHAIPNGQVWNEAPTELNKWTHYSFPITTTDDLAGVYFHILSEGNDKFKGYLDNFKVKDASGTEIFAFNIDETYLDNTSNGAKIVELPKEIVGKSYPAYKLTMSKGEIFRTTDTPSTNTVKYSFDYYLVKGKVTADSANVGNLATQLAEGVGSYTLTTDKNTRSLKLTADEDAVIYIWNAKVFADDVSKDFANRTDRTTCEFEEITFDDIPGANYGDAGDSGNGGTTAPAVDNYIMLIDTTKVADNGTDNKNFWFNELGMPGYKGKLESGKNYTVSFDVYPIKMPTSNNLFHYRTSSGSASSNAGWWKPEFELNKWQNTTHTFKVEDASKSGNHILYVYGGFKGYIDNFKLIDENNNVVEGTETDFTGLEIKKEDYKTYLTIEKEKTSSTLPGQTSKPNYAMFIDNPGNAEAFWPNEMGCQNATLVVGETYTVEFDFYATEFNGEEGELSLRLRNGLFGAGYAVDPKYMYHKVTKKNEWVTYSATVTAIDTVAAPLMYITKFVEGYFDNYTIKDSTGKVVYTFEPTAEDLGKTSNCATVVKLPNKIDPNYVPSSNLSGLEIAILKGKAGKDGASISLGGAKSPLTLESNKTYKLIFKYYQANPTASGELNLFGVKFIESVLGKSNDVTWFKKNNADGWTEVKVLFSTGNITNASADWFQLVLNPNAWVFFDDFTLEETEVDNNKEVTKITFDQKDDSIYPYFKQAECVFEQSSDFGGTFKAVNSTEYTNTSKNSNQTYTFKGIKMKSNTTYKVSIDFYNEAPFSDYASAFGYNATNLGNGSGNQWKFINNIQTTGWHTVSFTITTGEVIPNANYFNLVCYDVNDSSEPRTIWFDNFTITEQYTIETSLNDKTLGTVSKSFGAAAGDNVRVVANAFEGATFEGWYEYGDLVSTDKTYRLNNLDDNHKLEARFSGKAKPGTVIVQGFEDYELGDIGFEYYEIVSDSKNVLEGNKSLHVKPGKIMESIETSIFFPVISDKEYQMKEDYTYDVYVWVKAINKPENVHYYAFLGSNNRDQSDMLVSGEYAYIGVSTNIKPDGSKAVEEKDGWYKYLLGTVTKDHTDKDGFCFQICKFHANRAEGASIDDIYIDRVEVVERTPDFENLKYTEKFFNEVSNPNFENEITDENWGPLTDGVTVQEITDKEFDWQGNYNLKFDAAASNGKEYVRVIPIAKQGKNYTFAAWTKLSKGSDITVGLYSNGEYVPFDDVMNGETGKLKLIDNEKWNRVNFSFNSGDSENAYLVIKGTKGTLELDMVNIFIAERGFKEDPNTYGDYKTAFQETDPIAFPDKITTEEVLVEEGQEATNNKKYLITKEWVGPNVLVIVLSIVGGVLAAAAIAIVLIIVLAKKRKKN